MQPKDEERRNIVNDLFHLTGQKIGDDDPVVGLALYLRRDYADQTSEITKAISELKLQLQRQQRVIGAGVSEQSKKEILASVQRQSQPRQTLAPQRTVRWFVTLALCIASAVGGALFLPEYIPLGPGAEHVRAGRELYNLDKETREKVLHVLSQARKNNK